MPSWRQTLGLCLGLSLAGALRVPRRSLVRLSAEAPPKVSRTQRLLDRLDVTETGGAAGASGSFQGLLNLERNWQRLKSGATPPPGAKPFVRDYSDNGVDAAAALRDFPSEDGKVAPEFDVVVCGGALGVFMAAALQHRGLKVAVVERGLLQGREQEWNISLDEMEELVEAGALKAEDIDGALEKPERFGVTRSSDPKALVAAQFGSVRAGFNSEQLPRGDPELQEVWVPEVLNLGVRPAVAVGRARRNFEAAGGVVFERTGVEHIDVFGFGTRVQVTDAAGEARPLTTRLVVDAMGNASPIARQIRGDRRPYGVCAVVGTMASGYDLDNSFADLIFTNQDIWDKDVPKNEKDPLGSPRKQYFWEAFPAGSGAGDRTTYLFTYMDAEAERPSLMDMMEDYWDLLPEYQREGCSAFRDGLSVEEAVDAGRMDIKRCLYGCFPTYKDSPLPPPAPRIIAIGDASGIQSPLSFGGFGALTRHINRVADGITEAVQTGALSEKDLAKLNPYTPNLSVTWMFQRSMMVPVGSRRPPDFVNRLLRTNFQIMDDLGRKVLRPFNQDVVRPVGLIKVLSLAFVRDVGNLPKLLFYLGPLTLVDWLFHMGAMCSYYLLYKSLGGPLRSYADSLTAKESSAKDRKKAYGIRRTVDAWEFGSGEDYSGF